MAARRVHSYSLLIFLLCSLSPIAIAAQTEPHAVRHIGLGERVTCQSAIEEVYWRHRENSGIRASFNEAVPRDVIQRKAEDAVLKSLALERYWGVTITGAQLQAELDRMAAHTKSPDVLRELQTALGNDPELMAECLARPLIADRLIQSYYSRDERFHGDLKSRLRRELQAASGNLKGVSGQYREVEWRRGNSVKPTPSAATSLSLDSQAFDLRLQELRKTLASPSGLRSLGEGSVLREDDSRFYAVSVLELDGNRVRIATAEWQKVPFESWWQATRSQFPVLIAAPAFNYRVPQIGGSNCRDDSWLPTAQLLDPRYWHTAVWTGSEMIVFGGMSSVGTEYNDGGRYNPATDSWTLIASKGAPSVRTQHVAAWTGREMIVWGGTGDTSGGRYDPGTDTWKPISTTNAPFPRFNATVIWTGKEMIVWGGDLGSTLNSGGRYNPATNSWTPTANSPLAPRAFQTAVWTGTEMIIWAGYDGGIGKMYGDGATYNPATNDWKRVSSFGAPNARYFHTAVWTGTEMIVWGGVNYPNYDLSGGRYNPATNSWTPTNLANAPSLRWLHAAIWTGKEMIVQGGTPADPRGGRYNPATDAWTTTNPVNAAKNGQGITAVWTGREMIVWGGLDDDFVFHNDGGRYNPRTNSWLHTTTMNVPSARGLHSAVWTGSEMMVWGGFAGIFTNTGGLYDPATDSWRRTSVTGAPLGRENAVAVWTGTEAIFWGGDPDNYPQGTGGRYDPVSDSWKLITMTNAPIQRYGHTGVWTGTELIIFAGVVWDDAGWRYNPSTDTWKATSTLNGPGARDHHVAIWTGTEMIVWGGFIWNLNVPIGARYNPATDTWAAVNDAGSPGTREWAVSDWTGTEMLVWGGERLNSGESFNDGGRYNPATNSWRKISQAGAPSPRVGQGVWSGTELLIWGGDWDSSGGRYNPASDSWRSTTRVNAPFVRGGGRWSTVWTGSQMIIWGGIIETQEGNLYCASGTPNTAPVAGDDGYTATVNKLLVIGPQAGVLANDSDGNSDLLTARLLGTTAHGALQFNSNGSFRYKPTNGFTGTDSFTYQANDGLADSNIATVNITVQ